MSRWAPLAAFVLAPAFTAAMAVAAAPPSAPAWVPPRSHGSLPAAYSLAFALDGRTLTAGASDPGESLLLWEAASLRLRAALPVGPEVRFLGLYPGFTAGGRLVTCYYADRVRLWDLARLQAEADLPGEPGAGPYSTAVSPDGRRLAVVRSGHITVWDVGPPLRRFATLEGRTGGTCRAALSPDGRTLASVGDGGKVLRLWDLPTRRVRAVLQGHKGSRIGPVAFSPCGRLLASAGASPLDTRVLLWDVSGGTVLDAWPGHDMAEHLAFSADGTLLVAANDTTRSSRATTGEVRFWDVARRLEQKEWRIGTAGVAGFALSPDGKLLAFSEWGGSPRTLLYRMPHRLGTTPRPNAAATGASEGPGATVTKEMETLWADLAGQDAKKAYRAIWALAATPERAVALIRARLRLVPPPDAARLRRLVAELTDDSFETRRRASDELVLLGEAAEPELRQVLEGAGDLEQRERVRRLLDNLGGPLPPGDKLREVRAVEVLELAGTAEARRLLGELAGGAPGVRLTQEAQASLRRLRGNAGGRK